MILRLLDYVRPHCISSGWTLAGQVSSDLLIALAYFTLSMTLHRILRRGGGSLNVTAGTLKGAVLFIASCGLTHVLKVATLFWPAFDGMSVAVGIWTALISLWTMKRLLRQAPRLTQALRDAHTLETRVRQ